MNRNRKTQLIEQKKKQKAPAPITRRNNNGYIVMMICQFTNFKIVLYSNFQIYCNLSAVQNCYVTISATGGNISQQIRYNLTNYHHSYQMSQQHLESSVF